MLHLFCCLLRQCPESTPCYIIKLRIICLELRKKSRSYLGVNYQDLGVVGLKSNHKPILPSHKSLMSINFR